MSEIIISSGTTSVTTADASNTYLVESAGILDILNGGTAFSTTINGGQQWVGLNGGSGTASGTTINNGGVQYVGQQGPGTAVSTTINSGGYQLVGDGGSGTAIDTTISCTAARF